MKITGVRWTPYALPFVAALHTAQSAWRTREGIVLRLRTDAGVTGTGDVASLPAHGTATETECLAAFESAVPILVGADLADLPSILDAMLAREPLLAPLACAIDAAAWDARATAAGVSASRLFDPNAAAAVHVNALIDAVGCGEAGKAAEHAVAAGFTDIKLKVGVADSVAAEAERVAAVRRAAPAARLRVDANGAWSESQAIDAIRALQPCHIDLVEQPVPPGDAAALGRVRAATGARIAADESVSGVASVRALIAAQAVDAIVIKLPVVGGPARAREIAGVATAAGLGVIVTSAFESGVGVAAALQFAATLPAPPYAHGLATLNLLADDLIGGALRVKRGLMPVPAAPGIGVALDEAALAHYRTAPERTVGA